MGQGALWGHLQGQGHLFTSVLLPLCQGKQDAGACLTTPPDPCQPELCLLEQEAEVQRPSPGSEHLLRWIHAKSSPTSMSPGTCEICKAKRKRKPSG